jgi:hypothetical protein
MPPQQVLILAMTYMRSGICTAGFTTEPDPVSCLQWVRPVKGYGNLLLGDMIDDNGRIVECSDVVELQLHRPHPDPPHIEDAITDFIYHRPRLLRRLEGEHRARFFATHLDRAPQDVLTHQSRSLCLIKPDQLWASFALDPRSEKYEARVGFRLANIQHTRANSQRGIPVTDLKWRALGRKWLAQSPGELAFSGPELARRLQATDIYLALGLSRGYQGQYWVMVIGVHTVPDYEVSIDYDKP